MQKRSSNRLPASLDFSSQLLVDGRSYSGAPVVNLGLNGCCVRLPLTSAPHLKDDALVYLLLQSRQVSGPYAMKARLAWHSDPGPGKWIRAGLEFMEPSEACARELRAQLAP